MAETLLLQVLQGRLLEADLALHKLMTGQLVVTASYEGKSATYTQANISELKAYVAQLKQQIAELMGVGPRRGPIHFSF